MKLTIEQLSKLTKIPVPTLRVYVTRKGLGTKVGKSRVFTQVDVQKLQKSAKDPNRKAKAKVNISKSRTVRGSEKSKKQNNKESVKPKVALNKMESPVLEPRKRSFWSSLFGARKKSEKVDLLAVKSRR